MGLNIISFGSAVPEVYATTEEMLYVAKSVFRAPQKAHRKIDALYRGSGVEKRHCVVLRDRSDWVSEAPEYNMFYNPDVDDDPGPSTSSRMRSYEEHAHQLAETAARRALDQSNISAEAVTHLVTVTCTGFMAPGVDIRLIKALGLPATIKRAQVGFMGCQGAINGLRVADGFCSADKNAHVLICAFELCSLHYKYGWETKDTLSNALFADGAAAVVGTAQANGVSWPVRATGSCLVPESEDAMSWHIRDNGFVMGLDPSVPRLIGAELRPWVETWLDDIGLQLGDIKSWAVHPGGPSILRAVERALELPGDALAASWDVLRDHGNMSSPTILMILERLRAAGAPLPCAVLAFGPGLTVEAVVLGE